MGDSSPSCGERPLRWWDEEDESAAWWDEFPVSWEEKSPPFSVGERAFKAPPFRADASEVDGRLGAAFEAWRSSTSTEKSSSSSESKDFPLDVEEGDEARLSAGRKKRATLIH